MSIDNSCFNSIIGLSQTDCNCYDVSGYTTSLSGLYLDELEGINIKSLNDLPDCDKGVLVERYDKAYKNAVQQARNDIQIEAQNHFEARFNAFVGKIGLAQKTATYTGISQTYAYVRLLCRQLVGGSLTIKGISTLFESTGSKTLWVYNSLNELLATYTLNTTANTLTTNDFTDLKLPMFDDRVDYPEYYFVYEVGANRPKDNTLNCKTCGGGGYVFNRNAPCWQKNPYKKIGWSNFVCVSAGQTDTIDFEYPTTTSALGTYMLGLVLDVDISCDFKEFLCSSDFNYNNDPVALSIAFALRYKTGLNLCHDILSSGEINRWTMIDHDMIAANMELYDKKYMENVKFIGQNIDLTKSDCWICKEYFGIHKGRISV